MSFTPASWNLPLYLNQLQQEIKMIENYIGLTFSLIPVNGMVVTGSSQNYTCVGTNNTQYAYSSLQRNEPWEMSFICNSGTMFIGVSKDVTNIYDNASTISMQMIDNGIYVQTSTQKAGQIVSGQSIAVAYDCPNGSVLKLSYNGEDLNVYAGSTLIATEPLVSPPINMVIGCIDAGNASNITFTGSGGGGGGSTANLGEVLANPPQGNGNNLAISNISTLNTNGRITITNDQYDCIFVMNPTNGTNQFNFTADPNNLYIKGFDSNNFILTGAGDLSFVRFASKIVQVGNDSQVFDVKYNNPNYLANSNVSNLISKQFNVNTSISILQWDLTDHPNNNNFTCFIDNLSFSVNVQGENVTSKFVNFFITPVLNGNFDTSVADNVSWTSGNICPSTGGNVTQTGSNIIISNLTSTFPNTKLYLNVRINTNDLISAFYLQDITFKSTLTCNNVLSETLNPTTL